MKKIIIIAIVVTVLTGCNLVGETRGFDNENADYRYQSSYEDDDKENIENISEDVLNFNVEYDEWLKATKEDNYVITLIGASYCSHCIGFKPILESVCEKYNIPLYFYYINEINETDYNLIINEYETNYQGQVPHIFITKAGKVITNRTSAMNESDLTEFLKLNMIIE